MAAKAALAAVSFGASVLGKFAQANQAKKAAKLEQQAADAEFKNAQEVAFTNHQRQQEELDRQAALIDRRSRDEKSDLGRRVDAEMASLRVALGETGGAGSVSGDRLILDQEYLGAVEVSRVEANRKDAIGGIEADKSSVSQEFVNVNNRASLNHALTSAQSRLRASNARTNAFIGALSSGVQIASKAHGLSADRAAAIRSS